MSNTVEAICISCNGSNQLSEKALEKLGRSEPIPCVECGTMVKIRTDPASERQAKVSVLMLTIGAAIVAIVALINVFGDAGFPTYYVAIPFILISSVFVSGQNSKVLELENSNSGRAE